MTVLTSPTPMTHPAVKTSPLTRALTENRTRITAMMDNGLIATPIANGMTSLIACPTRFEDEGGHQTPFTSGAGLPASLPSRQRPSTRRSAVKKLLVVLILV